MVFTWFAMLIFSESYPDTFTSAANDNSLSTAVYAVTRNLNTPPYSLALGPADFFLFTGTKDLSQRTPS